MYPLLVLSIRVALDDTIATAVGRNFRFIQGSMLIEAVLMDVPNS